jgi:hypothetical protein
LVEIPFGPGQKIWADSDSFSDNFYKLGRDDLKDVLFLICLNLRVRDVAIVAERI